MEDYKEKYEQTLENIKRIKAANKDNKELVDFIEYNYPEIKESKDDEKPNGGIVSEDFNEGEGFYKVNLAYLNKEQVIEIEELVKKWNPELKESEDERIRKEIIKVFTGEVGFTPKEEAKKYVTWLEKQGKNNTDKIIKRARTEKQRILLTETNGNAHMSWDRRNLQDVKLLLKRGLKYIDSQIEKQGEQNLAWSEEDEKLLKLSVENLTELKDRFGEKYGKVGDCILWIKSLKERYTWKPSKEQMKALDDVISSRDIKYDILSELWKDLKKLKEE